MSPAHGYHFAPRALRRWRDERLTLTPRMEGGWQARFHFEGSTCGNVPFVLHYDIEVDAAGLIVGLHAAAAPGDEGHQSMCRHREDAASLRDELATQGPLRGRPLADVLAWKPATSPAGCVCTAPARAHKWLAALQTLHFALSEPKAPAASAPPHVPDTAGQNSPVQTHANPAAGASAVSPSAVTAAVARAPAPHCVPLSSSAPLS